VVVTSHSPNFASAARVERLTVLARPTPDAGVVARSPAEFGLTERQLGHLLRLLDVTKASLLFARGVVLVEGVAEQLLVPAFAQSLDRPLSRSGVAVINIGGVAFPPFAELFGPDKLPYRCAVVSDETRRSGPTPRSRRTLTRGCPPWPPRCGRARATTCSSYHGRTNLTMTMTAKNMPYKHGFGPFAGEIYRAPISYPFRDGGIGGLEAAKRAIALMDKQVSAENLAALVIEPIQGEGGFIVPAPGFLATLANWCRQSGVVFVADEVQSGMAYRGDVRLRARGRRARPGRVRQGPGRRAAAVRSDRPRRDHGRRARGWPRRHLRRQPARLRCRPPRLRHDPRGGTAGPRRRDREDHEGAADRAPDG